MNGYKFEYGDNPSEIAEKQIFRLLIASRYVRVNRAKVKPFLFSHLRVWSFYFSCLFFFLYTGLNSFNPIVFFVRVRFFLLVVCNFQRVWRRNSTASYKVKKN